jgi:hypothetical protein
MTSAAAEVANTPAKPILTKSVLLNVKCLSIEHLSLVNLSLITGLNDWFLLIKLNPYHSGYYKINPSKKATLRSLFLHIKWLIVYPTIKTLNACLAQSCS